MPYDSFLQYLRIQKRYSPHTVVSYRNDLGQFFQYISTQYQIDSAKDVTHQHIRSWMVSMMDKDLTPRTVNRKLSSLKSFYKFLMKKDEVNENPLQRIIAPKVPRSLPEFIEKDSIGSLFKSLGKLSPKEPEEQFSLMRDILLLEILYATGMRLSELINLKHGDIDLFKGYVKVLGKRKKERIIPIGKSLMDMVNAFIDLKKTFFSESHGTAQTMLLVTNKGNPLYPKFVYRKVKEYLNMAATNKKKSPHVFRHTFATHLLNSGAELNAIKELLGHASLAATQIYTHNTIEQLKKVHDQAHPKA